MNRMVVLLGEYASFCNWHGEAYDTPRFVNPYQKVRKLLLQNIGRPFIILHLGKWMVGEQA